MEACPDRPVDRYGLILHCLHHDAAELYTGDIPFPAKRNFPMLKQAEEDATRQVTNQYLLPLEPITPVETWILKAADTLEGMRYSRLYDRDMSHSVNGRWTIALAELLRTDYVPIEYRQAAKQIGEHYSFTPSRLPSI